MPNTKLPDSSRRSKTKQTFREVEIPSKFSEDLYIHLLSRIQCMYCGFNFFIINFPYNAHSDSLKQLALSENRERVDDGKLAFKFLLRNV